MGSSPTAPTYITAGQHRRDVRFSLREPLEAPRDPVREQVILTPGEVADLAEAVEPCGQQYRAIDHLFDKEEDAAVEGMPSPFARPAAEVAPVVALRQA